MYIILFCFWHILTKSTIYSQDKASSGNFVVGILSNILRILRSHNNIIVKNLLTLLKDINSQSLKILLQLRILDIFSKQNKNVIFYIIRQNYQIWKISNEQDTSYKIGILLS